MQSINKIRYWANVRWVSVAMCFLALAGCGDSGTASADSGSGSAGTSDAAKLAQLEASGAIPKLERLPLVEGIDIDRNGVRDDIDAYIRKTYIIEAQRKAAVQMARAYQAMLLVDKTDERALDEVSGQGARAVNCLSIVFPSLDDFKTGQRMVDELEAMTTNTKERLGSYLAFNKAMSGTTSTLPEGSTCD